MHIFFIRLKADLKSKKVERGTVEDSQGNDGEFTAKTKSNQGRKKVNAAEDDVSNASLVKDDDDDDDEEEDDEEEKDSDEDDAEDDEAADDENEEDQSEDTDVRICLFCFSSVLLFVLDYFASHDF